MISAQTRGRLVHVLVAVAAVLAGLHAIDASPVGVYYDDALYVILGKALAAGDGYRYLNLPGAPAATHYPPGYPALLAVLWRIAPHFPDNVVLFKTVNALLLGVVAWSTSRVARERFGMGRRASAVATIAGTATIPMLVLSAGVLSETLFLALLLPLLLVAERQVRRDGSGGAAVIGAAAGALCLVRSHAVAAVAAIAVAYLLERRRREALAAAAAGIALFAPWLVWVRVHDARIPEAVRGQYGSYTGWFLDGLRSARGGGGLGIVGAAIRDNLTTTYAIVARSVSPAQNGTLDAIAVLSVGFLGVLGIVACARKARVTLLFLLAYCGIVLVWPFSPLRFVWGIWPLIALVTTAGAVRGWSARADGRRARAWHAATGVAVVVAVAGTLLFNVRGYVNAWWATTARSLGPRIRMELEWVAARTTREDVIAGEDEGAVYLYTGRHAVPASAFTVDQYFRVRSTAENAAHLARVLDTYAPTYVVAWTVPTLEAATILSTGRPPRLLRVDTIPGGQVFRFLKVTQITGRDVPAR